MTTEYTRMEGCKNVFLLVDECQEETVPDKKWFVISHADRAGVDGVLFLSQDSSHPPRLSMRIFDADGTEETMCGNGIRCAARYAHDHGYMGCISSPAVILTRDGPKQVTVKHDAITVAMGAARDYRQVDDRTHFVFTGVPHLVTIEEKIDEDEACIKGRELRFDRDLCARLGHPEGINANFITIIDGHSLAILTYEVGVERIINACGTGSTAAAHVAQLLGACTYPVAVHNKGGILTIDRKIDVLLMTGPAHYLSPYTV